MHHNLSTLSRLLLVVFLLTAGFAMPSGTAKASAGAIFTVNSNSDADAVDEVCSLREAITAAIGNINYHGCNHTGSFGDDQIVFSITGSTTITLGSDLPVISTGTLTIDGSNSGRAVVIDGANAYEPFSINSGATLTLKNLTVQHGLGAPGGGAYNIGTLYVLNSSFLNNVSNSDGGAIENGGTITIANSTFSGNSADYGGGLINNSGTATILNSTFSGNTANVGGALSIYNGDYKPPVTIVKNTIMANSFTAEDCSNADTGTLTGNHNIIETMESGSGSCSSITTSTADPKLGSLTGSPAYLPLLSGSSGLYAGDNATCAAAPVSNKSQNGVTRPQGLKCDIGSYEKHVTKVNVTVKSIGAQDGWVLESSENSNVGGTKDSTANTFRLGDNAAKKQYRGVLSFGTGSLPDNAVITKVTLKLTKQGVTGGGNPVTTFQGFMLDTKNGFFGTTALQVSDFQASATHTLGPLSPALAGGVYSFDITSEKPYINLHATNSGVTQIRVRFKKDDNNNAIANYLSLYSGNNPTTSVRPALVVQYYVP